MAVNGTGAGLPVDAVVEDQGGEPEHPEGVLGSQLPVDGADVALLAAKSVTARAVMSRVSGSMGASVDAPQGLPVPVFLFYRGRHVLVAITCSAPEHPDRNGYVPEPGAGGSSGAGQITGLPGPAAVPAATEAAERTGNEQCAGDDQHPPECTGSQADTAEQQRKKEQYQYETHWFLFSRSRFVSREPVPSGPSGQTFSLIASGVCSRH
jgi:hypothetical protein